MIWRKWTPLYLGECIVPTGFYRKTRHGWEATRCSQLKRGKPTSTISLHRTVDMAWTAIIHGAPYNAPPFAVQGR